MTFRDWIDGPVREHCERGQVAEVRAAEILGVSRQSVRLWLAGRTPARTRLETLSARTGWAVSASEFGRAE